jgi:transcriptional regulator with XRE-family HTH domain
MRIWIVSCENSEKVRLGGQELGGWLRRQREARGWARPEMARRLIEAARANGDTAVPGVGSLVSNICRWERGTVGPSERYRLCYCRVFGISADDFGTGPAEGATYRFTISAGEVAGLLDDLRGLFRESRRVLSSLEAARTMRASPGLRDDRAVSLPDPDDAVRIAGSVADHPGWSVFWDKRYGVWRVSEDDPDSGLYAESNDAQVVLDYMAAHSYGK